MRERPSARGFTIMEVMVSIMLLAISVVSIFGAQWTAIATTRFSRGTTQAIELARCRMSEIELEILTEGGFETADVNSGGDCCELLEGEESIRDFSCSWEIKSVELPDLSQIMNGGGADGGTGMLGDLFDMGGDLTDDMGGGMGGMDETGAMGMLSAFGPMISDMLREAIRRVTVTVEWKDGSRSREFVLSQFLVHPTQGPLQLMNTAADVNERMDADSEMPPITGLGGP